MAERGVNIYLAAMAMRTSLGNRAETLDAMQRGECGLEYSEEFAMYVGRADVEPVEGYTRFESMMIEQIAEVSEQSGISLSSGDVRLVISTTKGNIGLLAEGCDTPAERTLLHASAEAVADYFSAANSPVVVSNACISGLSAFVVARNILLSGEARHVVVVGCDVLCEFITSGFASFKSVSTAPCRPYDARRDGLTLGEACGAVLLSTDEDMAVEPTIYFTGGAISNDANHISGPSRTGDGLYYAIRSAMVEGGIESGDVGFVNTHGTATRYNDEMESKAVAWAGLDDKPLNSLKGYIGHTLGASGVVEAIVCAEQLRRGYIFGTKNFDSSDVPCPLRLSAQPQHFMGDCCVKTASGFGGCNAAIVLDRTPRGAAVTKSAQGVRVVAEYALPASDRPFAEYIRAMYKSFGESNMKFYKMSDMCKALYVAMEHLLAKEDFGDVAPERRAIVLANRSASLDADIAHQRILDRHLAEGTSPAVFVYTLANVATGEMCIRHKIQGDNTFFVEREESGVAERYARSLVERGRADAVVCGWCEYLKGDWSVNIKLLKK